MNCIHPVPVTIEKKNGRIVKILAPCGTCEACQTKKKQQWVFRLTEHFNHAYSAFFITLTYDNNSVPCYYPLTRRIKSVFGVKEVTDFLPSVCSPNTVPGVSKPDVQKFLKRLRKRLHPYKIKYFLCSEYGPNTCRPHYHMILFDFPKCFDIYDYIDACWDKGFFSISDVNSARIAYVAKYCVNPRESNIVRPREFMLCSKGIGIQFLTDEMRSYLKRNLLSCIKKGDQVKPLPRYYKEKVFTYEEMDYMSKTVEMSMRDDYKELLRTLTNMTSEERENYFRNKSTNIEDFRRRVRKKSKEGKTI